MPSITEVLRTLGNNGAVANALRALDARDHEERLVSSLARRLDSLDLVAVSAVPGTATATAA